MDRGGGSKERVEGEGLVVGEKARELVLVQIFGLKREEI